VLSKQYFCDVDIAHLIQYDEELAQKLNNEPAEYIPLVGSAGLHRLRTTANTLRSSKQL